MDGTFLGDFFPRIRIIENLERDLEYLEFQPVRPYIPELTRDIRLTVQDMGPAGAHVVQIPDAGMGRPAGPDEVVPAKTAKSLANQGEILPMRDDVFVFMPI
nr:hypothetical protein [Megasphaera elsdenii]